ncbi:fungal-specific transcription factor domain-containing protein [Aspergillus venezuelensis]
MYGAEPPPKRPRLDSDAHSSLSLNHARPTETPTPTVPATATATATEPPPQRNADNDAASGRWRDSHDHAYPATPRYPDTIAITAPYAASPNPAPHTTASTRLADTHNPASDPFQYSSPGSGSWYQMQDGFAQDPGFLASQEELRAILFTLANSAAPTRTSSPEAGKREREYEWGLTSTTTSDASPAATTSNALGRRYHDQRRRREVGPKSPLTSRRRIEYLKNYVAEVAPWLDMFDTNCTFRQQLPALSHSFPPLLYAILAISARQMERKSGIQDWYDSLELYQEAIRLLGPLLQVRDPKIVAACVVLCCLEMMSARAQDWHRHLEGCAALFEASGIHGFCGGLLQAVFWCYARMDLCGALISDGTRTTVLHPSKWLPMGCREEDAHRLFKKVRSPDMHANYAVYLSVKATELVSDRTKFVELGEDNGCTPEVFASRWTSLWEKLQTWLSERPPELIPVQTITRKPFPHILFVHWAAISSNQLYHTACILLLKMMPKGLRMPRSPTLSLLWHARRICGISTSNKHQGCLNNAIQPLWIAGRLFSHASEHEQIVKIIRDIEAETGWGACWRIRDLEVAWGYSVGSRRETTMNQHFSTSINQNQHQVLVE